MSHDEWSDVIECMRKEQRPMTDMEIMLRHCLNRKTNPPWCRSRETTTIVYHPDKPTYNPCGELHAEIKAPHAVFKLVLTRLIIKATAQIPKGAEYRFGFSNLTYGVVTNIVKEMISLEIEYEWIENEREKKEKGKGK